MKHVAFFLSVVVAGIIIAAGAYVYSSSATWNVYGTGEGLTFEWFKQAVTFTAPDEAQTSHKEVTSTQRSNIKDSMFDLGDLHRGVADDYFYPKLYASKGTWLNEASFDHGYVIDLALDGQLYRARHPIGLESGGNSDNFPRQRGLSADRYYRAPLIGGGSGASQGGAGASRGSQGNSSNEGLPVVAQLLPLPDDVAELSPFIEEENPPEEELFNEPPEEELIVSDDQISQPVPEPATWLMVVAGLFLILLNRTKRSVVK